MNTRCSPEQLTVHIMQRSICAVQVGAVLVDDYGIFSWGWNSVGDGFGEHAEVSCLRRANLKRQPGSTLFVASQRRKHGKAITSKPCEKCQGWIEARGIEEVWWRGGDGLWHLL